MATSIDARATLNIDIHQWNKDSTSIAPQTTSEGTPNDDSPRVLWCLIEGDGVVLVSLAANQRITILKECIHAKGKTTVYAKDLELLKVDIPIDEHTDQTFRQLKVAENEGRVIDKPLMRLSYYWPTQPADDRLHVFVKRPLVPATNVLKRQRTDSHDDLDHPKRSRTVHVPAWLTELHSKIWGQEDRRQELFMSVEITTAHYKELEERLTKLHPNRHSETYEAQDVLSIKLEVLRSFKTRGATHATHATYPDIESYEAEGESNEVDDELYSLFPFTVEFLDLSSLKLETPLLRMTQPLLIRQEYNFLTKRLPDRPAILSGQPGTGKASYLYIRMVDSMIDGRPFLYQDLNGTVYHVSNAITIVYSWGSNSPIIAFIDADKTSVEPQEFLRQPSVQIIVATSPRGTTQSWLKQMGDALIPLKLVTAPWSPRELFITGIFLNRRDLTYARLKESTFYFGLNPRLCFNASISGDDLNRLTEDIRMLVFASSRKKDIGSLLYTFTKSFTLSHTIFELSPANDRRLFGQALVGAVSQWALNLLLEAYEERQLDAAAEFYDSIANDPKAGSLRGQMWERQVLKYLDSFKGPHVFSIRSLNNSSIIKWVYPGPAKRVVFQTSTLTQSLWSEVQPIHLVPKDPNYAALDSLVYLPHGLTLNQATVCMKHPVAVVGLKRVQGCLKRNTLLAHLRPSKDKPWPLIFIVPDSLADNFTKQPFEGDTATGEWASKVDQYVLGLREATVWGRTQSKHASPQARILEWLSLI